MSFKLKSTTLAAVKILFLIAHLFLNQETQAMGKKYSEQGRKLTAAMNSALLISGICPSARQCYELLPGTLETDTKILIHLYQINAQNKTALTTIVALALADGISITEGVPITIRAFRETQHEYVHSGLLIKEIKPFATIEIIK